MAEGKILVIDDEEIICHLLEDSLSAQGYTVITAQSGTEALKKVKQESFDMVITDIRMPDVTGIQILEEVKKINPQTLVIIMTAFASVKTAQEAIRKGAYDYITKPFEKGELDFAVKRAMEARRLTIANKNLNKNLQEFNIRLESKVRERTQKLATIYRIEKEISSTLELSEVLKVIVNRTIHVLDSGIISILLINDQGELYIKRAIGLNDKIIRETKLKLGERISGWVAQNKEAILIEDIEKAPLFAKENQERYYTRSLISAPLIFEGKVIGVINVNNKKSREAYTKDDLNFLEGIASQAAIAIRNAQLHADLRTSYVNIICAITNALEARDPYSYGHSSNVTDCARAIAEELGLDPSEKEILIHAALLHDVGKIGVSDAILLKPGKLTQAEWAIIKEHPQRGKEILEPLSFLKEAVPIVYHHHERYDGSGYPEGLKGEEIPLGARILAVADSYDAMSSDRPYRKRLSKKECIIELKKCVGTQLDSRIVEAFLRVLEKRTEDRGGKTEDRRRRTEDR